MKPRLLKAGFFWRSNDPADIIVGESSISDVVCIPPITISATDLNKTTGDSIVIRLESLEFIVAGLFGADRLSPKGASKWNGSAYRYGVYSMSNTLTGSDSIVILCHTPKGTKAIVLPRYTAEAWKSVFYGMPSDKVWDICWTLRQVSKVQESVTAEEAHVFYAAKKGETDAASNKADAVQHRANTNKTTGPQNLQGLHKEETVHNRAGSVEGSGSPSGERQRHQPSASFAAV